jgi:hypothetical protein
MALCDATQEEQQVRETIAPDNVAAALWTRPGKLSGAAHAVLVVKDGRRYWGTNHQTLTAREVKAHYSHRQQIEETFLTQARVWLGAVHVKNNKPSGPICTWGYMRSC